MRVMPGWFELNTTSLQIMQVFNSKWIFLIFDHAALLISVSQLHRQLVIAFSPYACLVQWYPGFRISGYIEASKTLIHLSRHWISNQTRYPDKNRSGYWIITALCYDILHSISGLLQNPGFCMSGNQVLLDYRSLENKCIGK